MYLFMGNCMKYLKLTSTDPYRNLAIEEFLFLHADEEILMLWQNAASVILGRNQSAYAEVDLSYANAHGIQIARRITGGGAVYHDLGNINYTFISPCAKNHSLDFAAFSKPITDALASFGIKATLTGRNDLEVDGKKISGNAQYRRGDRVLHHGTLLFDTDPTKLDAVLRPDEEKIRSRAIRSVHARVCNLRPLLPQIPDAGAFCVHLERFIDAHYAPTHICAPENEEIERLAERNASLDWLYPKKDMLSDYSTVKKKRYPFGTVEVRLEMSDDKIRSAHFVGDFFATAPVEELEALLCGTRLLEIEETLAKTDVGAYICGMRTEELARMLLAIE